MTAHRDVSASLPCRKLIIKETMLILTASTYKGRPVWALKAYDGPLMTDERVDEWMEVKTEAVKQVHFSYSIFRSVKQKSGSTQWEQPSSPRGREADGGGE